VPRLLIFSFCGIISCVTAIMTIKLLLIYLYSNLKFISEISLYCIVVGDKNGLLCTVRDREANKNSPEIFSLAQIQCAGP